MPVRRRKNPLRIVSMVASVFLCALVGLTAFGFNFATVSVNGDSTLRALLASHNEDVTLLSVYSLGKTTLSVSEGKLITGTDEGTSVTVNGFASVGILGDCTLTIQKPFYTATYKIVGGAIQD